MSNSSSVRILGVDPGLQKTGWGVIESKNNSLKYIACGHIRPNAKDEMATRLATLYHGLIAIIDEWQPHECALEETFVNKNPASALKLGQARGVLLMIPALKGLSMSEYSANKVKKSVVGAGHADKNQIQMMVKTLLPACGTLTEDEADALAVAITHAHYRGINSLISGA